MKKTLMTLTFALALFTIMSCEKESVQTTNDKELQDVSLIADFSDQDSKVTYSETGNILSPKWEVGDEIIGFNNDGVYTLTVKKVDGTTGAATLEGKAQRNCTIHLIYCEGKSAKDLNPDKTLSVKYDKAKIGNDMPAVVVADGKITNGVGTFTFKNAGSVIGITCTKPVESGKYIRSVNIAGKNLSEGTVIFNGTNLVLNAKSNDDDVICIPVNVQVGGDGKLSTPVYIAVPAGAVIEKVDIKVNSPELTAESYRLTTNKTMSAGGYTYIKTKTFSKKEGKQLWPGGPYWGLWNVNNIAHLATGRNSRHVGSYFTWGGVERHRLSSSGYWKAGESGSEVKKGFTEANFMLTAAYTDLQGKDVPLGDTRYDVAALLYKKDTKYTGDKVEISGDWRLPTSGELKKLVNNCHWVWATFDDGDGKDLAKYGCYIFVADASHPATGNGNAPSNNLSGLDVSKGIFLPAAGYGKDDALQSDGCALYWCADGPLNGTDWKNDPFKPRQLNFHSSKIQTYGDYKGKTGMLVRPVQD